MQGPTAAQALPLSSETLIRIAGLEQAQALKALNTRPEGLTSNEAKARLLKYGENRPIESKRKSLIIRIIEVFKDPLILLLSFMAIISFITGDMKAAIVIMAMVLMSSALRLSQELKADNAAEKLKEMVKTTATVSRDGKKQDIPLHLLVPGDIIHLSAGDLVPADVRIISSKDIFVNQSALTGESLPVEKHAPKVVPGSNALELGNICFMGTNIESGIAEAVVINTGTRTYFSSIAESILKESPNSFDEGIRNYAMFNIKLILVMAPLVLLINGITKGNWFEAFLFALAVVIGLAPEMMSMIVNVTLANGATRMAEKKVIIKKLHSIQNLGAMDVLCTDKTGTITEGRIVLEKHLDVEGNENNFRVLEYAYLNSVYQTGMKNVLDDAILAHAELEPKLKARQNFRKIDEITFDFERRRMSVIVQEDDKNPMLICKGAVEEVLGVCDLAEARGQRFKLEKGHLAKAKEIVDGLNNQGFRVIAVAYKETEKARKAYNIADESHLVLSGFIAFLDPPKESAIEAIRELREHGVHVKILTGDSELVTKNICSKVGIHAERFLLGNDIEKMSDERLGKEAEHIAIFAKLLPKHKERIINALRKNGHVVGFLGDGINDAPALRASDVGISVDTAVDIAKETSTVILLEKDLTVLTEGVKQGRGVFGNIIKYIKMAASSTFGNMFSVVGGSVFLPFLPMLPIQILVNNLLYDFSQTTIPSDGVDKEWLKKPRKWTLDSIKRFIFLIGPISSIFDFLTFFAMLYLFNAWANPALFQTGWFIESLFTQTLIIHVIRTNKIPFLQSNASLQIILSTSLVCLIGMALPYSPIGPALGLVPLPDGYWVFLGVTIAAYLALTQIVKAWFIRKFGED
jgi:Mg2+-importing ATPase